MPRRPKCGCKRNPPRCRGPCSPCRRRRGWHVGHPHQLCPCSSDTRCPYASAPSCRMPSRRSVIWPWLRPPPGSWLDLCPLPWARHCIWPSHSGRPQMPHVPQCHPHPVTPHRRRARRHPGRRDTPECRRAQWCRPVDSSSHDDHLTSWKSPRYVGSYDPEPLQLLATCPSHTGCSRRQASSAPWSCQAASCRCTTKSCKVQEEHNQPPSAWPGDGQIHCCSPWCPGSGPSWRTWKSHSCTSRPWPPLCPSSAGWSKPHSAPRCRGRPGWRDPSPPHHAMPSQWGCCRAPRPACWPSSAWHAARPRSSSGNLWP